MSTVAVKNEVLATPSLVQRIRALVMHPVLQKAGLSVFDQALVSGTSFFTSVLIGRAGGEEALGIYALAWSIVLFLRGVQEQLISGPYMIYCRKKTGRRLARYAGSSLAHQLSLVSLTSVGLAVAALGLYYTSTYPTLQPVLMVLVGALPFFLLREFVRHIEFAHFRMPVAIVLDASVAFIQIGLMLLFAWYEMLTVTTAFLAMAVSCLVACCGWWIAAQFPLTINQAAVVKDWRRNWGFGKWALASQLVGCTAIYVMPWVVAASRGEAATGVFAAGSTLVGLANMFVIGLSNYLSPKAAEAYADGGLTELKSVLWKTAGLFTVTLGAFCVFATIGGQLAAAFVYGDSFSAAGPVVAILSVNMWAGAMSITIGNGLWAMHRPAANFRADVFALISVMIATVILVPMFGAIGAAVSMLIGQFMDATIRLAILRGVMHEIASRQEAA
ncbi:lipopolysaccharide biosynthesis protein [Calycomorphotria hydatis]|uniref:MurJ-like flippase n=1 Tax=Calycomorphotria hydatis TaxID=2528027 RepID=A0A517TCS5_9PLAN|nr:lipopolysaccharide biosynthesis protein [Calycomorphotria hydatis]QDT66171.1 MurJ-like flippase [Calycomorphotria hydatis]